MSDTGESVTYYLVTVGDKDGSTARGPYTESEANALQAPNERVISQTRLGRLRNPQPFVVDTGSPARVADPFSWGKVAAQVHRWAIGLVVIGLLSLFWKQLDSAWGIIIILLGLIALYFEVPAMLLVYGTTLLWAAANNAMAGLAGAIGALVQLFIAVGLFRDYARARQGEKALLADTVDNPAERPGHLHQASLVFSWASLALGIISLLGLVAMLSLAVIAAVIQVSEAALNTVQLLVGILANLAAPSFGLALASLLSGYRFKGAAIGGLVASGLALLLVLVMVLISFVGGAAG